MAMPRDETSALPASPPVEPARAGLAPGMGANSCNFPVSAGVVRLNDEPPVHTTETGVSPAIDFTTFMRNYQDMVFSTAARLTGNDAQAEDISQEVFLKAYENYDHLGTSPTAGGWLKTVATNLALNHLTRYRNRWRFFSEFRRDNAADDRDAPEVEFAAPDTFFAGTGTPCDANNNGDPVVLYDDVSGRWIITDFAWTNLQSGPYYECIAVSKTGDPVSGGWWFYGMVAHANYLNDYPKLGVWQDGIYMTANLFDCITSTCSFATYEHVRVWALNRSDMISGSPLNFQFADLGSAYFSLLPAHARGQSMPGSGTRRRRHPQEQVRHAGHPLNDREQQRLFLMVEGGDVLRLRERNLARIVYRHALHRSQDDFRRIQTRRAAVEEPREVGGDPDIHPHIVDGVDLFGQMFGDLAQTHRIVLI